MPGDFADIAANVAKAFEVVGVGVIIVGFLIAVVLAFSALRREGGSSAYTVMRDALGRSVLLGLEVLVAADLVRTITVAPTLDNLLALGLLVVIRTFLSWSFQVELEGMWPWKKREVELRAAEKSSASATSD